jgi:hypothetical protein
MLSLLSIGSATLKELPAERVQQTVPPVYDVIKAGFRELLVEYLPI